MCHCEKIAPGRAAAVLWQEAIDRPCRIVRLLVRHVGLALYHRRYRNPLVMVALAVLVMLGTAGVAAAETYLWRPVAIGGGGFITGYDSDSEGRTRVVRADVYGAYLWVPEQNRWTQLVTAAAMPEEDRRQNGIAEGVYEIVVAPSRPERIYMVTKGHLYRSNDRGRSFVRASRAAPFPLDLDPNGPFRHFGPFMAVSPSDPDLVFLGTPGQGLLRSADAGGNWTKVEGVPAGGFVRPDRPIRQSPGVLPWFERGPGGRPTGRIWAMSAANGVFVSGDGGVRFVPLTAPDAPQPKTLKQGDFAPDGNFYGVDPFEKALWRHKLGVWQRLDGRGGFNPGRRPLAAVAIDPRKGRIYVFDEGGQAHRSLDGGERWQSLSHRARVGEQDPPWLRVANRSYFATSRVIFDPVIPGRLIASAGTGVFHADMESDPSTMTWTSETRGIEELVANDVVQPPGKAPLFAAWDFGIHSKPDLDAFSTGYGPKERVLISAQQIDWSPSDPNFIVTNASDHSFCCAGDGDAVLAGYSLDGGRSWSKFRTLPTPPGTGEQDPYRMSFGTIAVSSSDTRTIVWSPSFNRSPFYTRDRGATWFKVVLPGEQGDLTGSHEKLFYHRKTLAADRVLPDTFYLYHSGAGANRALVGLWRSQDGGATWVRRHFSEIAPSSQFSAKLRVVPGKAGHLFFTSGVDTGTDRSLRRSTDGGANWTILTRVQQVDDIAFGMAAPGAGYPAIYLSGRVDGDYGIWRSTDEAMNWTKLVDFPLGTLDQVTVMEADKDVFGRIYIGYKGSGWRYGLPATCSEEALTIAASSQCSRSR